MGDTCKLADVQCVSLVVLPRVLGKVHGIVQAARIRLCAFLQLSSTAAACPCLHLLPLLWISVLSLVSTPLPLDLLLLPAALQLSTAPGAEQQTP